jgi:hypothetical protein
MGVQELVIQPLQFVPLIAPKVFAHPQMQRKSSAEFPIFMLYLIKQLEDFIC